MKYERLSKRKINFVIISLGLIVIIGSVLVLNITKAKYKTTVSVPIVSGTINYSGGYDFKIMALYQQKKEDCSSDGDDCYTEIDEMPEVGYVINTSKSYCTLDGEGKEYDKLYTNDNGEHIFKKLKKNEKCYLYFDKEIKAGDTIIANSNVISETPDFSKTACIGACDTQEENGLYKTQDDFGDSYYFRGTVNDNWVKFGNMSTNGADIYWRIIRINGDGTIRLIYAGTGTSAPNPIGTHTNAITNQVFNDSTNNNMYVGYQYEENNVHGFGSDVNQSNAYIKLKEWFEDNLKDEWNNHAGLIDKNVGFCNDRSSSTDSSATWSEDMTDSGGTGKTKTYYGGYLRLISKKEPTLKCSTSDHKNEDYFTYIGADGIRQNGTNVIIRGTQSLEYPIGLITADEVAFAGGIPGHANEGYYLHTGQEYCTMTPFGDNIVLSMYAVDTNGNNTSKWISSSHGLRPVINLKADIKFTFEHPDEPKGTSTNPYIVS